MGYIYHIRGASATLPIHQLFQRVHACMRIQKCRVRATSAAAVLLPRAPARLRLRRQPVPVPSSEVIPMYMHPEAMVGCFAFAVCHGDVGPLVGWGCRGGAASVQRAAHWDSLSHAQLDSWSLACSIQTGAWGLYSALGSTLVLMATDEQGVQQKIPPFGGLILAIFRSACPCCVWWCKWCSSAAYGQPAAMKP
jgi:hypothetical protein